MSSPFRSSFRLPAGPAPDPEADPPHATAPTNGAHEVCDRWFRELDRRTLEVGSRRKTVVVLGAHPDGPDVWLQLSTAEEPATSLLLRVTPVTSVEGAINRLKWMLFRGRE